MSENLTAHMNQQSTASFRHSTLLLCRAFEEIISNHFGTEHEHFQLACIENEQSPAIRLIFTPNNDEEEKLLKKVHSIFSDLNKSKDIQIDYAPENLVISAKHPATLFDFLVDIVETHDITMIDYNFGHLAEIDDRPMHEIWKEVAPKIKHINEQIDHSPSSDIARLMYAPANMQFIDIETYNAYAQISLHGSASTLPLDLISKTIHLEFGLELPSDYRFNPVAAAIN